MDSNKIFETYNGLLINDSEILYKCMNFIYLFQMTGKIYICRFRRPMVVERIYYSPEIVIRNNEVLLRQCLTIPNENNNSRSLIILYISLIYNFNNN